MALFIAAYELAAGTTESWGTPRRNWGAAPDVVHRPAVIGSGWLDDPHAGS